MTLYRVLNPATEETEREYPTASSEEITEVLDRTDRAYPLWRATPIDERAEILLRVADTIEKRAEELGSIVTREMGKLIGSAVGEAKFSASIFRYYAENGARLLTDEQLISELPGTSLIRRTPIGPVFGIAPWNYPYFQIARVAAPNLIIGNTLVLKHSPQCPESALAFEALLHESGVPQDAYINVFADIEQASTIIADRRIHGVSFTGSERAGQSVAEIAGANLKKVVLELGGSDPYIVLDTDDVPAVARTCAKARVANAGQVCNGAKRFLVADELYDDFLSEFVAVMGEQVTGDPYDPATAYGPLASEQVVCTLVDQIDDAVSKGATVHCGGKRLSGPGYFVEATVLSGVNPQMRAYHEELFGPVAVVHRVADADEAIALANDNPYGLGSAVFTQDDATAMKVAEQLETGMVWINEAEGDSPDLPFGGTKRSGIGRELGPLGLDEYVYKKLIHIP
ncbi:NAD-dependent succinate-semialdehyde dehydrogenase [Mycobacterium sp. DL440]|uniref:NAD-dependent succinate-semialdehyde dehydrogenase n=1 Tax=Mycobacterium sp. DL440 TaxID=2675523 RepID=UPI00142268E8|nr:NAD-dependent succinate-semialdehyde dehydrogenase [Mycobacterium sp. DL440]